MALSDPIADLLTRIRNGAKAQRRFVDADWSKMKQSICEILKQQGFIDNYLVKQDSPQRGAIRIFLKYDAARKSVINNLRRVSKPGLRRYVKFTDIPYFYGGLGLAIVSTSQGVLPGLEANRRKIGGELLCTVW